MAQLQHLHNTQPKKGIYEFLLQVFTSEPPGKFTMCALYRVLQGKHLQGRLCNRLYSSWDRFACAVSLLNTLDGVHRGVVFNAHKWLCGRRGVVKE